MRQLKIMLIFVLVFASSSVIAIGADDSDSIIAEYPTHTCLPPLKPTDPGTFKGNKDIEQEVEQYNSEIGDYNSKVEEYNSKMQLYRNCIREYISSAKNDIKKIKKKISDAINEANSQ